MDVSRLETTENVKLNN